MVNSYLKKAPQRTYPYNIMESSSRLRAVIFDLDGVLVDSEPLHMASFQKALGDLGKGLSEDIYKDRYLSLDDRGAFRNFYQDQKLPLDDAMLKSLIGRKSEMFDQLVESEGVLPFPAVPEFVMALTQRYPLAVATGSLKKEAELLLESSGIRPHFEVIVSADDVAHGKPNPESYLKAVEDLNLNKDRTRPIRPEECVVIEDSKHVIAQIHSIGMKCIAVSTSYPAFELSGADLVVPAIAALRVSQVEDLFLPPQPMPVPSQQNQN